VTVGVVEAIPRVRVMKALARAMTRRGKGEDRADIASIVVRKDIGAGVEAEAGVEGGTGVGVEALAEARVEGGTGVERDEGRNEGEGSANIERGGKKEQETG